MGQAAALIAPPLRLSVALDRFGMFQPVALLVLGMAGTPLLLAVQAHLSVQRVGLLLATVVLAPAPGAGTPAGCRRADPDDNGRGRTVPGSRDRSSRRRLSSCRQLCPTKRPDRKPRSRLYIVGGLYSKLFKMETRRTGGFMLARCGSSLSCNGYDGSLFGSSV